MTVRLWRTPFMVNTTTVGGQFNGEVTALDDGGFVVAWTDASTDLTNTTVRWQRFDALGVKVGSELLSPGIGSQGKPDLVQLRDGNLWIVQNDKDSVGADIAGQVFALDGTEIRTQDPSSALAVNLGEVAVASLGNAGSVAIFTKSNATGGDVQIRYFTPQGVGGTISNIGDNAANRKFSPDVSASPDATQFAAVWTDENALDGGNIRCRIFQNGVQTVPEFTINSDTVNTQRDPTVAWISNSRFVVAWAEVQAGDGVSFRVFNSNGTVAVAEKSLNQVAGDFQREPDVVAMLDGGFAVAWVHTSNGQRSIQLQTFSSDGVAIDNPITVATLAFNSSPNMEMALLDDGRLVVTWHDNDFTASEMLSQIVDPRQGVINGDAEANNMYGIDYYSDTMHGFAASDFLSGLGGADEIYGDDGNDILAGGTQGDLLDGGNNIDTADYRTSASGQVNISLLADTASGGDAQGDFLNSIENLKGSLTLRDILIGNNDANTLEGFGGNDSLRGEGGDDYLSGGAGADALNAGAGASDWAGYRNSASGTVNVNLLLGTSSGGEAQGDSLFFVENLEGSLTLRDILIGNDVTNALVGNGGNDSLRGEGGADYIEGGTGADSLNGGAGVDTVAYITSASGVTVDLNVAVQVSGGDANGDTLYFFENVFGSINADTIRGSVTANWLFGLGDSDTLNGREGSDYLTGGNSNDTFRFDVSNLGVDTITDWEDGLDKISIGATVETSFAGLTFEAQGTTRVIIRGFNGSGAIAVESSAAFTLDAGDFVFI